MPIFGSKKPTPTETVKIICDNLNLILEQKEPGVDKVKKLDKIHEELYKNLSTLKQTVIKTTDHEPNSEIVAQTCHEVYKSQLLSLLIAALPFMDFECRKDTVHIFSYLLSRKVGVRMPTADCLLANSESTLLKLIQIYSLQEASLNVGMILRECIKNEELSKIIIFSERFYDFFHLIESKSFDIASDAFSTFKDLLTRHKKVVLDYLNNNYDKFMICYRGLMDSENYVTKRQSIKLLGDILLDKTNNQIMLKFVSSSDNLKMVMNLLRNTSANIQFESFHIFKVFIAIPEKSQNIIDILRKNKSLLVEFFASFLSSKDKDDEQFYDEKCYVIKTISEL